MSQLKKNSPRGANSAHSPFSDSLLKGEGPSSHRSRSQPAVKSGSSCGGVKRSEASPCRPKRRPKQNCLSYPSLCQLQAHVEAEYQQARDIVEPLLDTEKGFMKDLDSFLSQRDLTELRRKELLHKSWTQRVWFPLQRKVEGHVSRCGLADAKRRQTSYSHYLHHCNAKGFVFLETYDRKEYNPFPLNMRKQHLKGRPREKRTTPSYEAAPKHTWSRTEERLQSEHRLTESQVSKHSQPPLSCSVLALRKVPLTDESGRSKFTRSEPIALHISASATPDGQYHPASCAFSRCGWYQQTERSQLSQRSSALSK